jgi:hypothetical protein
MIDEPYTAPPAISRTSPIGRLEESIEMIFSGRAENTARGIALVDKVKEYAHYAKMDVEGYRVNRVDIDAMVRTTEKVFNSNNLDVVATALLLAFVKKSNVSGHDKYKAGAAIAENLRKNAGQNNKLDANTEVTKSKELSDKIAESKDSLLGGGFVGGAARVLVTIGGFMKATSLVYTAIKNSGKDTDINRAMKLLVASGVGLAAHQFGKEGKGIRQAIGDARNWVERVTCEPPSVSFGREKS